jgi:V/A-type H+/Na+-transporting ATPase subunit F
MKYAIIGDEDAIIGFGILGVPGKIASNTQEAQRAFEAILEDKDTGIIIITERVADMIRPLINKYLLTIGFPLVVEIPDRNGTQADRPKIKEMVNAAIGIKL